MKSDIDAIIQEKINEISIQQAVAVIANHAADLANGAKTLDALMEATKIDIAIHKIATYLHDSGDINIYERPACQSNIN
jgi:hypothetical protein